MVVSLRWQFVFQGTARRSRNPQRRILVWTHQRKSDCAHRQTPVRDFICFILLLLFFWITTRGVLTQAIPALFSSYVFIFFFLVLSRSVLACSFSSSSSLSHSHTLSSHYFFFLTLRHGANPITGGERFNLIVWFRDSQLRAAQEAQHVCTACGKSEHAHTHPHEHDHDDEHIH